MVIILINGEVLQPVGSVEPMPWGLTIVNGNTKNTIPSSQIKWLYENSDNGKEDEFAVLMRIKQMPSVIDTKGKSNMEVIKGMK